jgi:sugar (pentulose or hexulose) kinase
VTLSLGIDIGTSGVRAIAIDAAGKVRGQANVAMPPPTRDGDSVLQDAEIWWRAVVETLGRLAFLLRLDQVQAIAVDGTSGTLLLADEAGLPRGPARLYNDAGCRDEAARIAAVAPPDSGAHGASSALAKLLRLQDGGGEHALHQADWIAGRLLGRFGFSDENNALKLGYDVVQRRWPCWITTLGVRMELLPRVVPPGQVFGRISPAMAARFGFSPNAVIVAGTTDGCAAFLATGANEAGEGVTSLGSTLVLKLLSDRPIFAPEQGVYSHRLGERWLVGGASNSGGGALLRFFDEERMRELVGQLRPDRPTGLDFYPLPATGERFPIADPKLEPRVSPRPPDDATFFQGLLEGIAAIEARAYATLAALGAPALRSVRTVGKGAGNPAWTAIRGRCLGVPLLEPASQEAAYGAALLARQGLAP